MKTDTKQLTETNEENIEVKETDDEIEIVNEAPKVEKVPVANVDILAEKIKTTTEEVITASEKVETTSEEVV